MHDVRITLMELDDLPSAARTLSQAMVDNPLHVAVFQGRGEGERLAIEAMFVRLLRSAPGIVFVAREAERIVGVMRMKSCRGPEGGRSDETPADADDQESRVALWHREWSRRDPLDPHWHLGPIGVLATHRGRGIGSRLMTRFCREVDRCRATAYLETDLDENVRFYGGFGFEVVARSTIFGVENRYMLRAAQNRSS